MAAAMASRCYPSADKIILNYDSFTKKCENYVCASEETAENIKSFLKALYSVTKGTEVTEGLPSGETLPELITENFDEEQIWQELELQNEARVDSLVSSVARLVAQKDKFSLDTGPSITAVEENDSADDQESNASDAENSDIEENSDNDEIQEGDSDDEIELEMSDDSDRDGDSEENSDTEDKNKKQTKVKSKDLQKSKKNGKPSIVDDKFFKLSEMEEFLEREEQEKFPDDDDSSEESIDLFDDMPSDGSEEDEDEGDDNDEGDSGKKPHYSDFFDAPEQDAQDNDSQPAKTKEKKAQKEKKKVRWDMGGSGSENEGSESDNDVSGGSDSETSDLEVPGKSEVKSSYEIRQERLQAKIKKLEEEALTDKPWQLRGEVTGEARPENALLEEALEFDLTHRPAPVVTEETTHRLEDIIKQRVKDKAWDDVERKAKPVETPTEFKKKLVLDQEKSKLSLSQVYEQEYLKQVASADPDTSDKPEEIPKEHIEIKTLVNSLFRKLDALSNFHYTPKQVAPEVKIVTNIPAVNMEEVAPVATSDATLLAPEEVKAKPKGDIRSQGEKTDTDRKRERRQKKKHQGLVANEKQKRENAVSKLNPGLGNKYSKEKAMRLLEKVSKDSNVSLIENSRGGQAVKSSTTFFSQLQDEVTSQVKQKSQGANKRKKDSKSLSAKRLKL